MVYKKKQSKLPPFLRILEYIAKGLLQCSRTRDEIYVRSPFIRCNVESINQDLLGSFLSERRRDFWHQKICSMYLVLGKSCRNVNFNQEETLFLDSKVVPKKINIRIESAGSIIIFKMKKNKKGCTHFSKRSQYVHKNWSILSLHTYFPLRLALKISNNSTNRAVHHSRWYY